MGNPGSFWWLGLFMAAGVLLWAGSPTARPIKGPHGSDDDFLDSVWNTVGAPYHPLYVCF